MIKDYDELVKTEDVFSQGNVNNKFDSFTSYSDSDAEKVFENEEKIENIVENEKLWEYVESVKTYFRMLKDFFTGKYKKLPVGTIAAIIGTLLYVLSPVDFIPDLIPVVGYLDDAAMLALCARFTQFDVEEYLRATAATV